ncbi:MAG: ABC transporter ATP-binding protein [Nitrospinae bacterium]|nr:ABC transporter ATP-binding protein [Nitrospinota bacterium]
MPLIQLTDITKVYGAENKNPFTALAGVSLQIEAGEFAAIMGPSGSGKSTLMHILGCLDTPTKGQYHLDGGNVDRLQGDQLAAVRNRKIGFVFQGFNLIPRTNALENVELPMLYSGVAPGERRRRAGEAMRHMGLTGWEKHRPNELSGGQQQRVAIARAIVNDAPLILADEPTGNLDTKTSAEIMELFVRINREKGKTIILVTHEADIAAYSRRIIRVRDGLIVTDEPREGR